MMDWSTSTGCFLIPQNSIREQVGQIRNVLPDIPYLTIFYCVFPLPRDILFAISIGFCAFHVSDFVTTSIVNCKGPRL
jgi:hypothetical protein